MRTLILCAALLAPAAAFAAGGQHTLEARVSFEGRTYRQSLRLTEGRQASFVGPTGGKAMILNALLASGGDGYRLQYQLELSGGRGAQGRSLQLQSEAALRPGEQLETLACGPWKVALTLDPGARPEAGAPAPNYRLTADADAAGARQVCALLSLAGTQSNVVDGTRQGDRRFGFILNALFSRDGGGWRLQYQLEQHPPGSPAPFSLQNEEPLALGRKTELSGEGYRLALLLEGPARGAPKKKSGVAPAR